MTGRLAGAIVLLLVGWALAAPAMSHAAVHANQLEMLSAVNEVRAQHGLRLFRGDAGLHRSAHAYAHWMLRNGYFGHLSRIRASGFSRIGETLALHSGLRPSPRTTVRRWLASPPHRALMLSPRFRWLGAGLARGRFGGGAAALWVLHLGG